MEADATCGEVKGAQDHCTNVSSLGDSHFHSLPLTDTHFFGQISSLEIDGLPQSEIQLSHGTLAPLSSLRG